MSRKIKPLTLHSVNELQIILGAMELGDYDASLSACRRNEEIAKQLSAEVETVIEERHQDELKRHRAEMQEIRAQVPVGSLANTSHAANPRPAAGLRVPLAFCNDRFQHFFV